MSASEPSGVGIRGVGAVRGPGAGVKLEAHAWRFRLAAGVARPSANCATYGAGAGAPPSVDPASFLLLNFILLLPLIAIIAWRLVQVWAERRRGLAGSRLHVRLVVLFGLVAVIPTIIVAIFSYLFFSFGVQAWFSERSATARPESLAVAEAYLHEHQQTIRADVVGMATDLNRDANLLSLDPQRFEQVGARAGGAALADRGGRLRRRRGAAGAHGLQLRARIEPVPDWALASAPTPAMSR